MRDAFLVEVGQAAEEFLHDATVLGLVEGRLHVVAGKVTLVAKFHYHEEVPARVLRDAIEGEDTRVGKVCHHCNLVIELATIGPRQRQVEHL